MATNIDELLARAETAGRRGNIDASTLGDNLELLNFLKDAVKRGSMTVTDFQGYAEPIVKKSELITQTIASQGGKAASSVNPLWSQIQNGGFVQPVNGRWVATLPFSRKEYASLPEASLPSQAEVNQGLFDPTYAPISRYRPDTAQTQPPTTPTDGSLPQAPAPVVGTLPSAPSTVTSPGGGTTGGNTAGGRDEAQLIAEAELQKQLAAEAAAGREAKRKGYLTELGGLLDQSNQQAFDLNRPDIYEDLNSRGLLRSSETGNALARKQGELQQARDLELSKQALAYSDENTADLKGIQQNYLADRESAISRRYSLEDYQRQLSASKELGQYAAEIAPKTDSGKSASTQQATAAVLSGGQTATQAGMMAKGGK